jgi:glycosyltransferase involved in cell wall biosynthesis
MKILFISRYIPDDPQKVHGTFKRLFTFIEAIKDIAKLDMLFFVSPNGNYPPSRIRELEDYLSKLWQADIELSICPMSEFDDDSKLKKWLSFGKGIYSFFNQKGRIEYSGEVQLKAVENRLDRNPDAIFAHRLSAMCPLLLTKKPLPPIFFDMDDVEHVVLSRYIKNRKNIRSKFLNMALPALTSGEYKAIKFATKTAVCSELDRKYLDEKFHLPGVITIPNSVDIPKLEPITSEPTLLFLGVDYKPNIEAAKYLVNEIWPFVRNGLPHAKLIIGGTSADKLGFKVTGIPGLEVPGFVDDLNELYRKVRATAVPILVAGGTRFKIIEAAAYGKPTVATAVGAEGIEFTDGAEILIRDDPKEFAEACIKLLVDTDLCTRMGIAAREKAIELYDRKNVIKTIRNHIVSLLKSDKH